jgi:hypothetical protein
VLAEATSTWQLRALIEGVSMQGSVRAGPRYLSRFVLSPGDCGGGRVSRDLKTSSKENGARYGRFGMW